MRTWRVSGTPPGPAPTWPDGAVIVPNPARVSVLVSGEDSENAYRLLKHWVETGSVRYGTYEEVK